MLRRSAAAARVPVPVRLPANVRASTDGPCVQWGFGLLTQACVLLLSANLFYFLKLLSFSFLIDFN
jgi:hypothetical protein